MESTTLKISGIYGPIIGRCEKGPPKRLASTRPMAMPKVITMISLVGTRASKMAIFSVQLVILRIITGASTMPILPKTKIPTLPDTIVVKAMPKKPLP